MNASRKEPAPKVQPWVPMTEAEVDDLPPLPRSGPRGWETDGAAGTSRDARHPRDAAAAGPCSPEPELPDGIGEGTTHAFVFHHPHQAAGVVGSLLRSAAAAGADGPLAGMTSQQVVAAFFIALGPEIGSCVLRLLPPVEAAAAVQAIRSMPEITCAAGLHALEQVRQRIVAGEYAQFGGEECARRLAEKALGPHRAAALLGRSVPARSAWEILSEVAPVQVVPFLSHEHPQTVALILSQLPARQAAGLLAQLPERLQAEVTYRIATMENIARPVIQQIAESLEQSLGDLLGGDVDVGGPKVVADIVNLTGSSVEKNVLDQMDAADPEVAESVRNLMFTFGDIAKVTDREIQILLREVDQKDLVVALKAASEELKTKFLRNMSEEVGTFITQEMEFLGPMRLSEVEEVQLRIVQQVRILEERGQITIVRGDTHDVFV